MGDWYQTTFVETGRSAAPWLLIGFVVTYAVTRWITLRIRARTLSGAGGASSPIKDVHIGGVHVHHQVWGILLVLLTGLLEFRFQPSSPWVDVLAVCFGAGAALALDEFALWLHLEDVYWSEEGRKSIDAVLLAAVVGLVLLVSGWPTRRRSGLAGSTPSRRPPRQQAPRAHPRPAGQAAGPVLRRTLTAGARAFVRRWGARPQNPPGCGPRRRPPSSAIPPRAAP